MQTVTYPGGKELAHTYDALGRLTSQKDWGGRIYNFTYDNAGRLASRTYPNGVTQENAFDEAGRLSNLKYDNFNGSPGMEWRYKHDKNGNTTHVAEKGTLD